ncbi:hypothetical protein EDB86DRAFT_3244858 [Lactarius hatsudake]|nr:hypothetical protein EDB86DRAFT_3244858 [Lactarius hatsudake]
MLSPPLHCPYHCRYRRTVTYRAQHQLQQKMNKDKSTGSHPTTVATRIRVKRDVVQARAGDTVESRVEKLSAPGWETEERWTGVEPLVPCCHRHKCYTHHYRCCDRNVAAIATLSWQLPLSSHPAYVSVHHCGCVDVFVMSVGACTGGGKGVAGVSHGVVILVVSTCQGNRSRKEANSSEVLTSGSDVAVVIPSFWLRCVDDEVVRSAVRGLELVAVGRVWAASSHCEKVIDGEAIEVLWRKRKNEIDDRLPTPTPTRVNEHDVTIARNEATLTEQLKKFSAD